MIKRDSVTPRATPVPEAGAADPKAPHCGCACHETREPRSAAADGRMAQPPPIGRRSSGVAHLPQEKFQRRSSTLSGLELRLDTSSFLQAPTYCRNRRREWNFPLLHYFLRGFGQRLAARLVAAGLLRTAARQITRYPVSAPRRAPAS